MTMESERSLVFASDSARMEAAVKTLSESATRIEAILDELAARIRQLVPQWSGQAAYTYFQRQGQWLQEMTETLEALQRLTTIASDQTAQFDEHEAYRTARW